MKVAQKQQLETTISFTPSNYVASFYVGPITVYYCGNGTEIPGSTKVKRYRVYRIPAVVDTTSTGVLWEWRLPLPERYIIFGAACTEIMRHIGLEQSTVII